MCLSESTHRPVGNPAGDRERAGHSVVVLAGNQCLILIPHALFFFIFLNRFSFRRIIATRFSFFTSPLALNLIRTRAPVFLHVFVTALLGGGSPLLCLKREGVPRYE